MENTKENMEKFLRAGNTFRAWLDKGGTWHPRPGAGPKDNTFVIPTEEELNANPDGIFDNYIASPLGAVHKMIDRMNENVTQGIEPHQVDARIVAGATFSDKIRKWANDIATKPAHFLKPKDKDFLRGNIEWSWNKISPNKKYMELSLTERLNVLEQYHNTPAP